MFACIWLEWIHAAFVDKSAVKHSLSNNISVKRKLILILDTMWPNILFIFALIVEIYPEETTLTLEHIG